MNHLSPDRVSSPALDRARTVGPDAEISLKLTDGLSLPQRYWAIGAIWLTMAMSVLDGAIANVALPTIAHDLGASPAASIWVVNAYQIAITMLLLPLASLGEILGYKRVYVAGVIIFVLSSLGCTFADSLLTLSLSRFIQGFGAAAIMAVNGALVRFTYPRAMLGRGLGYNAFVVALAAAAGPSIAAVILAIASWRWLFAVNIPIGLVALAIGWRYLPSSPRNGRPFDWQSALLTCLAFAAFFFVASDIAHGTFSPITIGLLGTGIFAAIILTRRARRQDAPLIPLDLLRIPILRLSYITSSCSFAAQMIGLVALPFYLQGRFGFDHVETGLLLTSVPVGVAVAAPLAGRLVEHFPAGLLGGIGLGLLALGYLMLAMIGGAVPLALLVAAMAMCGFGFGLFQAPNNRTMLGAAPPHRSGAAAGMLATSRLFGQTLGAVGVALFLRLAGATSAAPFFAAAALGVIAAIFSFRRLSLSS
jgi:DHA2 family multidrug resistance protein-like MFS transporter